MENSATEALIGKLVQFGLTRQEANIYLCLMRNNALSGYEVSKMTGISRSNVYSALASLVEEGAAYLLEGGTNKYTAVSPEDFCRSKIRHLNKIMDEITSEIPKLDACCDGYITISTPRRIMDKIYNMLEAVHHRVYISIPVDYMDELRSPLKRLISEGKKVVLLISEPLENELEGATVYITQKRDRQLRLIVDSEFVLTGDMTRAETDSALYCAQKNFVNVFKDSLRNEIRLIELTREQRKMEDI